MSANLIFFVDAFPYTHLKHAKYLSSLPNNLAVQSGFGYSFNIHGEIFCGRNPDEIGFFNKWTIDDDSPFKHLRKYSSLFRLMSCNQSIEGYLRNRISKIDKSDAVPLWLLPWLAKKRFNVKTIECPYPSIFNQFEKLKLIEPEQFSGYDRDAAIYHETIKSIEDGCSNILCFYLGLDTAGHDYGINSPQVIEKIIQMDNWIKIAYEKILIKHPCANLVVFSDHGMADITKLVNPNDIIKNIKKKVKSKIIYFVDSVMLRIWTSCEEDIKLINNILKANNDGILLSREDRCFYGVTHRDSGDALFVLNEGYLFHPDFFVGEYRSKDETVKSMHGFLPLSEKLQGIFVHNCADIELPQHQINTKDIYGWLCKLLR